MIGAEENDDTAFFKQEVELTLLLCRSSLNSKINVEKNCNSLEQCVRPMQRELDDN